jgi:hypothetical protein
MAGGTSRMVAPLTVRTRAQVDEQVARLRAALEEVAAAESQR